MWLNSQGHMTTHEFVSAGGFDIAENFTVHVFKVSVLAGRGSQSKSINSRRCRQTLDFANKQQTICVFPVRSCNGMRTSRAWATAYGGTARKMRYQHSLLHKLAEELKKSASITKSSKFIRIHQNSRWILASENIAIMIYNFSTFGRGENTTAALLSYFS